VRNRSPSIRAGELLSRAVTAKSALRRTVVMYALRTRGHRPVPGSRDEEPKQIAELQSSHARQSGKRAPKKVCAVNHAARYGQRKEKESHRDQRVHRVVIRQEPPCNPRKYCEDNYHDSKRHIGIISLCGLV
jgi:hypothetical protein